MMFGTSSGFAGGLTSKRRKKVGQYNDIININSFLVVKVGRGHTLKL